MGEVRRAVSVCVVRAKQAYFSGAGSQGSCSAQTGDTALGGEEEVVGPGFLWKKSMCSKQ